MYEDTKTAAFYYSGTVILGLGLSMTLLIILNWPLLAEIPLAVCVFIQIIALSHSFYTSWVSNQENFFNTLLTNLKTLTMLEWDSSDEEIGLYKQHKKASQ